ncbi:unnamed protein product [Lymnaea stagnalis]|uniref:Uncharacterized protein n=1 Tax=Lymnaea stagnalis TaxID=6523 RepID=A0AAV2HUN6_LYMST
MMANVDKDMPVLSNEEATSAGIKCLVELPNDVQKRNIFEHFMAYELKELFLPNEQDLDVFDVIIRFPNGQIDVLSDEEEFGADRLSTCEKVCIVPAGSVAQQGPQLQDVDAAVHLHD